MIEIKLELRKYLIHFKNKKKYQIKDVNGINKILNSNEYFEFINKIYEYHNLKNNFKPQALEGRLCLQCYSEVDRMINSFWEKLLGPELNKEFQSKLKLKLKY